MRKILLKMLRSATPGQVQPYDQSLSEEFVGRAVVVIDGFEDRLLPGTLLTLALRHPGCRFVVILYKPDEVDMAEIQCCGISALAIYSLTARVLGKAIRTATEDRPASAAGIYPTPSAATARQMGLSRLSSRELQVLTLVQRECSYDQIADELHIAASTVRSYAASIRYKLGVGSLAQLSSSHAGAVRGIC